MRSCGWQPLTTGAKLSSKRRLWVVVLMRLCDRIRLARSTAKRSQASIARDLGVSGSAVAQWEGRSGTVPSPRNLIRLAALLDVSCDWLATGRGASARALDPSVALEFIALDSLEERILRAVRLLAGHEKRLVVQIAEAAALLNESSQPKSRSSEPSRGNLLRNAQRADR